MPVYDLQYLLARRNRSSCSSNVSKANLDDHDAADANFGVEVAHVMLEAEELFGGLVDESPGHVALAPRHGALGQHRRVRTPLDPAEASTGCHIF